MSVASLLNRLIPQPALLVRTVRSQQEMMNMSKSVSNWLNDKKIQEKMDEARMSIYYIIDCYSKQVIEATGKDGLEMVKKLLDDAGKFAELLEKKTGARAWCH